jgi:hypothetical protein
MFLCARGWIAHPAPHPRAPTRPEADRAVLAALAARLGVSGVPAA